MLPRTGCWALTGHGLGSGFSRTFPLQSGQANEVIPQKTLQILRGITSVTPQTSGQALAEAWAKENLRHAERIQRKHRRPPGRNHQLSLRNNAARSLEWKHSGILKQFRDLQNNLEQGLVAFEKQRIHKFSLQSVPEAQDMPANRTAVLWQNFTALHGYVSQSPHKHFLAQLLTGREIHRLLCVLNHDETLSLKERARRVNYVLQSWKDMSINHLVDETMRSEAALAEAYMWGYSDAKLYLETLRLDGISLKMHSCMDLFRGLMRGRPKFLTILRLLDDIKRHGVTPDTQLCTLLIDYFGSHKSIKNMMAIYEKMETWKVKPNLATYTALISTCVDVGDTSKVGKILRSMKTHINGTDFRFRCVMARYFVATNQLQLAEQILDQECKKREQVAVADSQRDHGLCLLYTIIMEAHVNAGQIHIAEAFFEQLIESGIPPDIPAFTVIICGHVRFGELARAEKMLSRLFTYDLRPDTYLCGVLLDGYIQKKDLLSAARIIQSMLQDGISLEEVPFGKIIQLHLIRDEEKTAMDTFLALVPLVSETRVRQIWVKVVVSLLKRGSWAKVEEWVHLFQKTPYSLGQIPQWCEAPSANVDSPISSPPRASSHNDAQCWPALTIHELLNLQHVGAANNFWRTLYSSSDTSLLTDSALCAYIRLYATTGNLSLLQDTLDTIFSSGRLVPTHNTYTAYITTLVARDSPKPALDVIYQDLPFHNLEPSSDMIGPLLMLLRTRKMRREIRDLRGYLQRFGDCTKRVADIEAKGGWVWKEVLWA